MTEPEVKSESQVADEQEAHDLATGFCLITSHLNLYAGLITKNKMQIGQALSVTQALLKANPGFMARHKAQASAFLENAKEQIEATEKPKEDEAK